MLTEINELVSQNRFEAIFKALKNHPLGEEDERFDLQLNQMRASFSNLQNGEIDGTATADHINWEEAMLRRGIMKFARRFEITHVEASPVPVTTPRISLPDSGNVQATADKPVILFLGSNPKGWGKLQLDAEFVNILERMGDRKGLFKVNTAFRTTSGELMETLLEERPSYLHFAGHGVPAAGEDDPAGIVLETEDKQPRVVSAEALGAMFSLMVTEFEIKSVVLNACDTLDQARAISVNGIHSVGMAREIPDDVAISFAGGFYLGLAQRPDDIPRAFKYAITMLKLSFSGQDDLPKLFFDGAEVTV